MSSKLSDLWSAKPMLKRTLTGMAVQICCQFTGTNVSAGALGQIVTFVFICFVLDRVGRRLPLIVGAFGMARCLAIEAAINARFPGETTHNPAAQRAGVAFIILFGSLFFSCSFGPVSWVYQPEIFPMRIRAMGTSVSTMANWAINVMISQVSPIGLHRLGWKFYLVFICTNIANALIVIFFFPETKGKSLEEMDAVFGDQVIDHALETGHTNNVPGLDSKAESEDHMEKVG
ncbi:Sugar (and other) transporter [Ceratobasidium sp. AG-Ba]|nr:Sugar (and other) transporter [Ceratobasidium sp. AG-Ba]